jgi:hypothetical protein
MIIDLQQVMNSSLSLRLVSLLSQGLPSRLGYRIAYGLAEQITRRRESRLVQTIRANQWVVSGEKLKGEMLDYAVRETIRLARENK